MTAPLIGPHRPRHRRLARHRPRRGAGACRGRRACRRGRPHRRRARRARRRDPGEGRRAPRWCRSTSRTSPAIDRLGAAIFERWGKLDMLLGNAGVLGVLTPLSHLEPKVFDEVMAVNVTANWRLIRSLDPLLRQSDAGRALFVTSGAASAAAPFWGIYSASKAALEALVQTYAGELAQTSATRQPHRPRAASHRHARQGDAGRRPGDAAAARSRRPGHRPHAVAGFRRERRDLPRPRPVDDGAACAGVTVVRSPRRHRFGCSGGRAR